MAQTELRDAAKPKKNGSCPRFQSGFKMNKGLFAVLVLTGATLFDFLWQINMLSAILGRVNSRRIDAAVLRSCCISFLCLAPFLRASLDSTAASLRNRFSEEVMHEQLEIVQLDLAHSHAKHLFVACALVQFALTGSIVLTMPSFIWVDISSVGPPCAFSIVLSSIVVCFPYTATRNLRTLVIILCLFIPACMYAASFSPTARVPMEMMLAAFGYNITCLTVLMRRRFVSIFKLSSAISSELESSGE